MKISIFFIYWLVLFMPISEVYGDVLNSGRFSYSYTAEDSVCRRSGAVISRGKVVIRDQYGTVVYSDLTGYVPGCDCFDSLAVYDFNGPFVSAVKKNKNAKLVGFCGSTGGRHYLLRLYQPYIGMVASLDFFDGPVDFSLDNEGVYTSVVYNKIYIKAINSMVSYPVVYRLIGTGSTVSFSADCRSSAYSFYKNYSDSMFLKYKETGDVLCAVKSAISLYFIGDSDGYSCVLNSITDGDGRNIPLSRLISCEIEDNFFCFFNN